MDHIMESLKQEKWSNIKKIIKNKKMIWNEPIDQINGMIHHLGYHNKLDIIKLIDYDLLQQLIHEPNLEGDTICHIAAKVHNYELLSLILSIDINTIYDRNILKCTPLYYIMTNKDFIVQLTNDLEIMNHYVSENMTLLDYYINNDEYDFVLNLIDKISINLLKDPIIFTVIESDLKSDQKIKMLEKLQHLDLNRLDRRFLSPLILATYLGDQNLIEHILINGGYCNYAGPEGIDHPLSIAIIENYSNIIDLFLKFKIKTDIPNKFLQTPVHILFQKKRPELTISTKIRILELFGNNINLCDMNMNSVLNLILQNDNWHDYENILKKIKLKIYLKNQFGKAPIDNVVKSDIELFYNLVFNSYINQLDSNIMWKDDIDNKIASILNNSNNIESYAAHISYKIKNGQSFPIKKKHCELKLIKFPFVNITNFTAYTHDYIHYIYYLLTKYPYLKIPIISNDQAKENENIKDLYLKLIDDFKGPKTENKTFRSIIREFINHSSCLINHIIIWMNEETYYFSPYIIQGIIETLEKYSDTKFIILKLTIITDSQFNHANILIYDVENNTIERFDPYGKVPFIDKKIDALLKNFLLDYLPNIKYISAEELTNNISFQVFSDEMNKANYVEHDPYGFCVAWCLWYIEIRIINSKISPNKLIKKMTYLINKSGIKFKDYIRNYSSYLDDQKNLILQKAGLPYKYWYATNMSKNIYNSYIKHIRELYKELI